MNGTSASDTLTGDSGRDVMSGGDGADRFDFDAANSATAGNQAFTFIDTNAFSNSAGQLRYTPASGGQALIVEGDMNGDGKADFQIAIRGSATVALADFIL